MGVGMAESVAMTHRVRTRAFLIRDLVAVELRKTLCLYLVLRARVII